MNNQNIKEINGDKDRKNKRSNNRTEKCTIKPVLDNKNYILH